MTRVHKFRAVRTDGDFRTGTAGLAELESDHSSAEITVVGVPTFVGDSQPRSDKRSCAPLSVPSSCGMRKQFLSARQFLAGTARIMGCLRGR